MQFFAVVVVFSVGSLYVCFLFVSCIVFLTVSCFVPFLLLYLILFRVSLLILSLFSCNFLLWSLYLVFAHCVYAFCSFAASFFLPFRVLYPFCCDILCYFVFLFLHLVFFDAIFC